jgi:hypothetical protein
MSEDAAEFLRKIGVETRFVSILDGNVFINNLRFSRFSRKREEIFLRRFPGWRVVRSKVFQKICTRASRVLSKVLTPGDKIFILKDDNCFNLMLYVILEPYKRKYGIEIMGDGEITNFRGTVDSIAMPITLDQEAENIIQLVLNGDKIELLSSNEKLNHIKLIYPLLNVPRSWIESWIEKQCFECSYPVNQDVSDGDFSKDLMDFLEGFIPNVRENIYKSALYASKI